MAKGSRKVHGMKAAPSMKGIHKAAMRRIRSGRPMQGLMKGGGKTKGAC